MSFSQSLLIGDNTLRELDKCENERVYPAEFVTPSGKRKCSTTNNVTLVKKSCERNINNDANNNKEANASINVLVPPLDVVDDSPTDKSHTLGKSIKERLRNISAIRSEEKRNLRRSKSVTVSKNQTENQHPVYLLNTANKRSKGTGSAFDSKVQCKSKYKSDRTDLDGDSFDQYIQNIQTQHKTVKSPNLQNQARTERSLEREGNFSELFSSQFTLEAEQLNVSKIERMMQTKVNITECPIVPGSENLFSDNDICDGNNAHGLSVANPKDSIQWEESLFFDNSDVIAQHEKSLINAMRENEHESIKLEQSAHVEADLHDFIAEEIQFCKANKDISMVLMELNNKSSHNASSAQLLHQSPFNRTSKICEGKTKNLNRSRTRRSHLSATDMANLADWGCSNLVLNEYRKKGIERMFEWQADCLGNENVISSLPFHVYRMMLN